MNISTKLYILSVILSFLAVVFSNLGKKSDERFSLYMFTAVNLALESFMFYEHGNRNQAIFLQ